ncbi:hypothetical protein [Streptomyces sp. NBC_01578]
MCDVIVSADAAEDVHLVELSAELLDEQLTRQVLVAETSEGGDAHSRPRQ